ncbi:DciA family protein [Alloscardovia venturai]|uniref:DciA family protein n=1 Tax=Alloscardovia venturai TaxID=1769421 RepID=A0ABW2Y7I4_9BIFI
MTPPVTETCHLNQAALADTLFKPYAFRFAPRPDYDDRNDKAALSFGQPGREPLALGIALEAITGNPLWREKMTTAKLFGKWSDIVGENFARNSRVSSYMSGILTIQAQSPAWATQLSYMTEPIKTKIKEVIPSLDIQEIRITGPQPEPFKRKRY